MSSSAYTTSYRQQLRLVRTNAMAIWVVLLDRVRCSTCRG